MGSTCFTCGPHSTFQILLYGYVVLLGVLVMNKKAEVKVNPLTKVTQGYPGRCVLTS